MLIILCKGVIWKVLKMNKLKMLLLKLIILQVGVMPVMGASKDELSSSESSRKYFSDAISKAKATSRSFQYGAVDAERQKLRRDAVRAADLKAELKLEKK